MKSVPISCRPPMEVFFTVNEGCLEPLRVALFSVLLHNASASAPVRAHVLSCRPFFSCTPAQRRWLVYQRLTSRRRFRGLVRQSVNWSTPRAFWKSLRRLVRAEIESARLAARTGCRPTED